MGSSRVGCSLLVGFFVCGMFGGEVCAQSQPDSLAENASAQATSKTKNRPSRKPSKELQELLAKQPKQTSPVRQNAAQAKPPAQVVVKIQPEIKISTIAKKLVDAEAMINNGKAAEAYALLEPMEFDLAGDLKFDYLLGISALNSAHPDRATIALERVMATNASYGEVELWMAIAYYQSGDMQRAQQVFNAVLAHSQVEASQASANQFLAAIKQQEEARAQAATAGTRPYWIGNIETGMGYDNNIGSIAADYAAGFSSAFSGSQTTALAGIAGKFFMLNGGVEGRYPLRVTGSYAFASLDASKRAYPSQNMMSSKALVVKGGMNFIKGSDTYKLDINRRESRQDGLSANLGITSDSAQTGLAGDARWVLTASDYLGAITQYNQIRYKTNASQDTNQIILGVNYMHVFQTKRIPLIYFALMQINDNAMNTFPAYSGGGNTDLSRKAKNAVLYAQCTCIENTDIITTLTANWRIDAQPYARAITTAIGKDNTYTAMLGVNWRPAVNWTVRAQTTKTRNLSNIALYTYQKIESSISVKREFK